MKLLEEIPTFPPAVRAALRGGYGIDSAEAFFAHAVRRGDDLARALGMAGAEIERLARLVEGHLDAGYVVRCRQPLVDRARGLVPGRGQQ